MESDHLTMHDYLTRFQRDLFLNRMTANWKRVAAGPAPALDVIPGHIVDQDRHRGPASE